MSATVICLGEEKAGGKCPLTFALSSWASAVLTVSMSVRVAISSPVEYTTAICSVSVALLRHVRRMSLALLTSRRRRRSPDNALLVVT